MPKINHRPIGENSPNLVTLIPKSPSRSSNAQTKPSPNWRKFAQSCHPDPKVTESIFSFAGEKGNPCHFLASWISSFPRRVEPAREKKL
jgi:hypothetical protein